MTKHVMPTDGSSSADRSVKAIKAEEWQEPLTGYTRDEAGKCDRLGWKVGDVLERKHRGIPIRCIITAIGERVVLAYALGLDADYEAAGWNLTSKAWRRIAKDALISVREDHVDRKRRELAQATKASATGI